MRTLHMAALICFVLLLLYLFIDTIYQNRASVNKPAISDSALTEDGSKEDDVIQEGRAQPPLSSEAISRLKIVRPSQQEVEEWIRQGKERKERYEKMVADRDRALTRRRMSEW